MHFGYPQTEKLQLENLNHKLDELTGTTPSKRKKRDHDSPTLYTDCVHTTQNATD